MIKHIVGWNLKETAHGNSKEKNAILIKEMLEALKDKIPEIEKIEVGIDFSKTEFSFDVVLYSEFQSIDDLEAYKIHPEHKKVVDFVVEAVNDRKVGDYEI